MVGEVVSARVLVGSGTRQKGSGLGLSNGDGNGGFFFGVCRKGEWLEHVP